MSRPYDQSYFMCGAKTSNGRGERGKYAHECGRRSGHNGFHMCICHHNNSEAPCGYQWEGKKIA